MMKVIDLTHTIGSNMSVYPGSEPPVLEQVHTLMKDGFREKRITMYSHIGTHIDAPSHLLEEDAKCLGDLHMEQFVGKAAVLDFSMHAGNKIKLEELKPYHTRISASEYVIIRTDWSRFWGTEKYYKGFPCLSEEGAEYLSGFNLKGIGVDTISVDAVDALDFVNHKIFMKKDILIIENLTNLDAICSDNFWLSILPLKIENADGSPVRAVALLP